MQNARVRARTDVQRYATPPLTVSQDADFNEEALTLHVRLLARLAVKPPRMSDILSLSSRKSRRDSARRNCLR
jgi:hypothetical protein